MTNQKLFEALQRVCGFTALESDMFEIIRAVEADKMTMTETIEQAAERYAQKKGDIPTTELHLLLKDLILLKNVRRLGID